MDQEQERVNEVEPPAGITFANVMPTCSLLVDKSQGSGYQILETNPAQEQYTRYMKHKRSDYPRKRMYFSNELTAKKLRILSNSGVVDELQHFFEKYPKAKDLVNLPDNKKRTALHFAASRGADDLVHLLLQQGADPNAQDCNGNTPLHLAACTNFIRVVTILLRFGADVKKVDAGGKTPLNLSLSRSKMLSKNTTGGKYSTYTLEKKKAEVLEIIAMLTEYFDKSGRREDYFKMCNMKSQLLLVETDEGVRNLANVFIHNSQMKAFRSIFILFPLKILYQRI